MLASVLALSDDDAEPPPSPLPPPKRKRTGADTCALVRSDLRQKLRVVVDRKCFCASKSKVKSHPDCLAPFRAQPLFDQVLKVREELRGMQKADADQRAPCQTQFNLDRAQAVGLR